MLPFRTIIPVGQLPAQLEPYRYRGETHDRHVEALKLQVKHREELQAMQLVPFE